MAEELMRGAESTVGQASEQVAALVRAIRRTHGSPSGYGGVERFTVTDIHDLEAS